MISMQAAMKIVLDQQITLDRRNVPLSEASGQFLAEAVVSPIDVPPFDKSAMDGYAVLRGDERREFQVLETVAAGAVPSRLLEEGACIKIMTGAALPQDTGRVIRVEFVERVGDVIEVHTPEPYENIIRRGENLKTGDMLMPLKRLGPGDVGSLAASGIAAVQVNRQVRVGILSTGNEIKEPGEELEPGEIYNSNGVQLSAQVREAGAEPIRYGIVSDDRTEHRNAVEQAADECDLVLLTGGVSMGDFDYVPDTLQDVGFEILFHGVKVKPGRPVLFGRRPGSKGLDTFVFGLPGNPVSAFILFETMVKPLLWKFNGLEHRPKMTTGKLLSEIRRKDSERMEFRPIRFVHPQLVSPPLIEAVRYMGSAHLNALVETEGFVVLEPGVDRIPEGSIVSVRLI